MVWNLTNPNSKDYVGIKIKYGWWRNGGGGYWVAEIIEHVSDNIYKVFNLARKNFYYCRLDFIQMKKSGGNLDLKQCDNNLSCSFTWVEE